MLIVGILIGLGAALLFAVVGIGCVVAGVSTTRNEIARSFAPDKPNPLQRGATLAGYWVPILGVLALCLLAAFRIVQIIVLAF
jgi:hypothetical protein